MNYLQIQAILKKYESTNRHFQNINTLVKKQKNLTENLDQTQLFPLMNNAFLGQKNTSDADIKPFFDELLNTIKPELPNSYSASYNLAKAGCFNLVNFKKLSEANSIKINETIAEKEITEK